MIDSDQQRISILLVDDHALFRESVARLLTSDPGLHVVAHCESIEKALAALRTMHVDIVLLDFDVRFKTDDVGLISKACAGPFYLHHGMPQHRGYFFLGQYRFAARLVVRLIGCPRRASKCGTRGFGRGFAACRKHETQSNRDHDHCASGAGSERTRADGPRADQRRVATVG